MLKKGDYIGISACSDSRKEFERKYIEYDIQYRGN